MLTVTDTDSLRSYIHAWREAGERVAFVPTMGNLHEGHLQLVDAARSQASRVVVSIFVNPAQFGPNEDFAAYPRTPEQDSELLAARRADLLYMPGVDSMYPGGEGAMTRVEPPEALTNILCGASRPGHFSGVATVVTKLLNQVQPDVAVFGEKDFQQLLVIRRVVADLDLPVAIVGVPTVREADGLAMSSRNRYLDSDERVQAAQLSAILREMAGRLQQGERDFAALEAAAAAQLRRAGFVPDYVSIRCATDLTTPGRGDTALVILAAARLGEARLIDNLQLDLSN
ncbi:MAG: pantoate--beta-alanine ligase [Granulosicoccaceae bacterium]|jgi:pantoate--beta-alanine ligase